MLLSLLFWPLNAARSWLWSPRRHRRDVLALAAWVVVVPTVVAVWLAATAGQVWIGLELVPVAEVTA